MTQHTPGPWEAGLLDSTGVPIYSGPTDEAEVLAYVSDVNSGDTEANARLIAAAPALLAAAEAALDQLAAKRPTYDPVGDAHVRRQLRAAIKQAKEGAK